MADAWRIVALNWKLYLKHIWPFALFTALTNAFFLALTMLYVRQQICPAWLFYQSGGDAEIAQQIALPTTNYAIYLVLAFILLIFSNLLFLTKTFTLMKEYKEKNCFLSTPTPSFNHEEWGVCLKWLYTSALTLFVGGLFIALFVAAALKWTIWILIAIPFLVLFACSFNLLFAVKHALFNLSFKSSSLYALKHAFGTPIIVLLLSFIPVGIILSICSCPLLLYIGSQWAAVRSSLTGDVVNSPLLIDLTFFVINSLCLFLSALAVSYPLWAITLKTNSQKR